MRALHHCLLALLLWCLLGAKASYSEQANKTKLQVLSDKDLSFHLGTSLYKSSLSVYDLALHKTLFKKKSVALNYLILPLDVTLVSFLSVAMHEIYGHGARLREFGTPALKYEVTPFSGRTYYPRNYLHLTDKKIAITIAGLESQNLLANQLREASLQHQTFSYLHALSYLSNRLSQLIYTYRSSTPGHDIENYASKLTQTFEGNTVFSKQKLQHLELLSLLDPFLFYSAYAIGQHLHNMPSTPYPMLSIGQVKYLPAFELLYTTHGPELQLHNFFSFKQYYGKLSLSYGDWTLHKTFSVMASINNLYQTNKLTLGLRGGLWHQPRLSTKNYVLYRDVEREWYSFQTKHNRTPRYDEEFHFYSLAQAPLHYGGLINLSLSYHVLNNWDLNTDLGYKSSGFSPGEALQAGPIIRLGIAASF